MFQIETRGSTAIKLFDFRANCVTCARTYEKKILNLIFIWRVAKVVSRAQDHEYNLHVSFYFTILWDIYTKTDLMC